MAVLVLYTTTDGQTGKIARAIADRLAAAELVDAARATPAPGGFAAAVIAAPLRIGRYPASIVAYARRHAATLARLPTAFVSVSLAAAGTAPQDRAGLARCVDDFMRRTGWTPGEVVHVAGAFRFTRYSLPTRWALKLIAWRKGQPTDTSRDHELTDWAALDRWADRFAARLPG